MRVAISEAIHQLKDGAPEFGIESLDAVYVNSIDVAQDSASAVAIKSTFRDAEIRYLSNSDINKIAIDFKKNLIRGESFTPKMEFAGNYGMEGKILFLPITGKGKGNVTFVGLTARHDLQMEPIKKEDGKVYWSVKNYKIKFSPKRAIFDFQNLFNGDKLLGKAMNEVLNTNWQLILTEILPSYEKKFGLIFKDLANKIFLNVAMNEIFLED